MAQTPVNRSLMLIPLCVAMLACALTNALNRVGGEPAPSPVPASQEPIYIIVEGEVEATSAPAQPPAPAVTPIRLSTSAPAVPGNLVLQPCADRLADCPKSEHYITFIEIGPPNEESFDMDADTELYVSVSWNAVDEATLQQNLANVRFILEIDGQDWFDERFTYLETKPYILDETQIDSQKTMSATISGWLPQQPHTLRFGYEVLEDINNGRYSFDAGDEFTHILHICPDGGCPPSP